MRRIGAAEKQNIEPDKTSHDLRLNIGNERMLFIIYLSFSLLNLTDGPPNVVTSVVQRGELYVSST